MRSNISFLIYQKGQGACMVDKYMGLGQRGLYTYAVVNAGRRSVVWNVSYQQLRGEALRRAPMAYGLSRSF